MSRGNSRRGRRYVPVRFTTVNHRLPTETFAWCLVCPFRRHAESNPAKSAATTHSAITGHAVRWDSFSSGAVVPEGVDLPGWTE